MSGARVPWRRLPSAAARYAVLCLFLAATVAPFLWMWSSALRSSREIFTDPFSLPSRLDITNLVKAWTVGRFRAYFRNTIIITAPTVTAVASLSCLAGYALGRMRLAWGGPLLYLFLLGLMVPFQSIMIPLYYLLRDVRMIGTFWGMILPATALGLPFGVFLMQAFFRGLPGELADAARVDGCGELRLFRRVMLPLTGPAVSSLVVFQFMWTWNAFLMPLVYLQREDLRPLALGLMFFQGRYTQDYGLIAGGVAIVTIPIIVVYIALQRQFVRGLTAGALKG
jgi:ABC-type glycerol-3-phosphate transport system permease component